MGLYIDWLGTESMIEIDVLLWEQCEVALEQKRGSVEEESDRLRRQNKTDEENAVAIMSQNENGCHR